jgi:hypothetical protein
MFCTNGVLLRKLVGSGRLMMKETGVALDELDEFSGLDATHVIVVSLLWNAFIFSIDVGDNINSYSVSE